MCVGARARPPEAGGMGRSPKDPAAPPRRGRVGITWAKSMGPKLPKLIRKLPKVPPGGPILSPALAPHGPHSALRAPRSALFSIKFLSKIYQKSLSIFNIVFYWFLDPLGLPKPSPNHFQIVQKLCWDRLHIENVDFHEIIQTPTENQQRCHPGAPQHDPKSTQVGPKR